MTIARLRPWIAHGAFSLILFLITAATYSSLGVVLPAMVKDLGWSWSEAGLGFTLMGAATGASSWFPAALIRRFGLRATLAAGRVLDAARSSPADIEAAVRSLRAVTGTLVTEVHRDGDAACRPKVQTTVLAMSKEQLLRDRSMLLMQGWEPDPKAIPPLADLLAR